MAILNDAPLPSGTAPCGVRWSAALLLALVTACSSGLPPATGTRSGDTTAPSTTVERDGPETTESETNAVEPSGPEASASEAEAPDAEPNETDVEVVIDTTDELGAVSPRMFGTNLPAWLGPERLADPAFHAATLESGTTLIRMPGGSWSNHYDWRACELSDEDGCFWTWAARPTDFIDYLQSTNLEGMWTVSINDTAQAAAGAVAFFNGEVGDMTPIGVDRRGRDWETVDHWARLRAANGNPDPVGIRLWEVGNEVFGGQPASGGAECADFGWEEVWTCDGAEYVAGTAEHDGYLQIRAAMRSVDDSIEVGAVGVGPTDTWTGWGNEVIDGAAEQLDFYVLHAYGFDASPSPEQALARPAELWPDLVRSVAGTLEEHDLARVPIAVTEYNLVSFDSGDTEATMTTAMNALFVADTIGQLTVSGATIANQWDLASGTAESGTNYGLLDGDDAYRRFPQFHALRLWSGAGTALLASSVVGADDAELHVYPTRHDDGTVTIIAINLDARPLDTSFQLPEAETGDVAIEGVSATDLTSSSMTQFEQTMSAGGDSFTLEIPAWSVTRIDIGAGPTSSD